MDKNTDYFKTKYINGDQVGFVFTDAINVPIKRGTRIKKINSESGDAHKNGSFGVVVGSVGPIPFQGKDVYAYFVEWDDSRGLPVGTIESKILEVNTND